jgi:hypothetical protein
LIGPVSMEGELVQSRTNCTAVLAVAEHWMVEERLIGSGQSASRMVDMLKPEME